MTAMKNIVVGANEADHHYCNANIDRDFTVDVIADLRTAQAGDLAPRGDGISRWHAGLKPVTFLCWGQNTAKR